MESCSKPTGCCGWLTDILLVAGGLNWALVGLWDWNLVTWLFQAWWPMGETVVYALVGLAALWRLIGWFMNCKK